MHAKGSFAEAGGLSIYYEEAGTGHPLVLLHGSMATNAVWRPYLPFLAEEFRLIMPDARGHGRTSLPDGRIDVEILAQDCLALLKVLGLEQVFLCGWSMGADVSLAVALRFPEMVRGLIIGGQTYRTTDVYSATLWAMGLEGPGEINFERAQESIPDLIATWQNEHTQSRTHWKELLTRLSFEMANPSLPSREAIKELRTPALIIWGDRDQFLPVEQAVELYRLMPNGELAVVPRADHFVSRTHVEQFAARMREFMMRNLGRKTATHEEI
jgi:pimeloyl-ACP methyl ester carboxylesterase